ncbi:protein NRT1/ PTR FAMILY 5.10 [Zea mays]|uniref:protein NRT1/ PTR FAMILY 5.10 n=1 Tax=Zea mays TaxID=4577 RepID=UPI0009AAE228|nr:protein NRT1/ PTR FAMILY 5.10 [Zea mays]|eukprot:XP_020408399.1 protein NRT1/ PTR FAMILY 5.10 [Zea mays]
MGVCMHAAAEIGERFAFYAVASTLITYLTGPLQEGIAAAAAATNVWNGTALMLPLLGGAIADLWLGRYLTIVLASLLYILGLGLLAVSTVVGGQHCDAAAHTAGEKCPPPPAAQVVLFYVSLYVVAVGEGGHKPCAHAFGADQFSGSDPGESVSRGAFFNWWYFGVCAGTVATLLVVSYVQENLGWGLGFAVPCAVMACALAVFLLGTRTYRHTGDTVGTRNGLFAHAAEAFAGCWRRQRRSSSSSRVDEEAQVATTNTAVLLVSETKDVLRLLPIWATTLVYAVVYSQSMTFFTKQAATLDRRVGELAKVPAAALLAFISVTIMALIPVYDRVVVPLARRYTGRPSGITMLQRIGAGMLLSVASTVTAALVEARRLRVARAAAGLLADTPGKAAAQQQLPMSLWWMVPQYVVFGAADVFAMVGLQEFFYDQVPDRLRSVGLALYISVFGVGSFVSSALVSGIHRATAARGQSWFSDNMNGGHLDYFYWLLAALSALQFFAYVFVAWRYKYKDAGAEHT